MSPISGISRTVSFSDIVTTAQNTGDKTTLTVGNDTVTKRGTSSFSRFFYNLIDKFSSRHASGDANSLTAFQSLVARQYGAQALDLLNQQMHISDERSLSAGLVKRAVLFLDTNKAEMDYLDAQNAVADLNFFPPQAHQTAPIYAKACAYSVLFGDLKGANPEDFAEACMVQVQKEMSTYFPDANTAAFLHIFGKKLQEMKAQVSAPSMLEAIKHMEKILNIKEPPLPTAQAQKMEFRARTVGEPVRSYKPALMEAFSTAYANMEDPTSFAEDFAKQLLSTIRKEWPSAAENCLIPQFLVDLKARASKMDAQGKLIVEGIREKLKIYTSISVKLASEPRLAMKVLGKEEKLGGQPVDGKDLRPDACYQGYNTCFIMSGVLGMLSASSTKEYLLDRLHTDSNGQYHVRLTMPQCAEHPSFDIEVVVPPNAISSYPYVRLNTRPKAFAAIECAVSNVIQEYGLDSSFSPGSVGYSHLFHQLIGLTEGENMRTFCDGIPAEVLRDKLNDLLSNQDTILTLRIHERNHWVCILGVEGDKVRIGNSLSPDRAETISLAKLLDEMQNLFSGYDLIVGHLPRT